MASAKQIAWRKKFAKMAKSGKFRKSSKPKTKNDWFKEYRKSGGKKSRLEAYRTLSNTTFSMLVKRAKK